MEGCDASSRASTEYRNLENIDITRDGKSGTRATDRKGLDCASLGLKKSELVLKRQVLSEQDAERANKEFAAFAQRSEGSEGGV